MNGEVVVVQGCDSGGEGGGAWRQWCDYGGTRDEGGGCMVAMMFEDGDGDGGGKVAEWRRDDEDGVRVVVTMLMEADMQGVRRLMGGDGDETTMVVVMLVERVADGGGDEEGEMVV
ncbi:hypothetical protein Tco_1075067 [Tanacetum coccineum]